MLPSSMMRCI